MLLMDECNYSPSIAAYGFGGHSLDSKTTSSCTALNGNPDNPNIDGIEVSLSLIVPSILFITFTVLIQIVGHVYVYIACMYINTILCRM